MLADIRPNEEHAKEHIERNPVTTVAQVVPEMSEHEVSFLIRNDSNNLLRPVAEAPDHQLLWLAGQKLLISVLTDIGQHKRCHVCNQGNKPC